MEINTPLVVITITKDHLALIGYMAMLSFVVFTWYWFVLNKKMYKKHSDAFTAAAKEIDEYRKEYDEACRDVKAQSRDMASELKKLKTVLAMVNHSRNKDAADN